MNKIIFKKVSSSEWEKVKKIEQTADTNLFRPYPGEKAFKKTILESVFCFIQQNGETIGLIQYEQKSKNEVYVGDLVVLPEFRNQGIAKLAFKKLFNDLGDEKYSLHTHPQNTPAIISYLKVGFKIMKWVDDYHGTGKPRLYLEKN